jgi:phosphoglycerol transferase MdoB-like AlkP superfamily enzyme
MEKVPSNGDVPSTATAFLNGVWFDNVIACYLMIVPLAVLLAAACFGRYERGWRKGVSIWFSILYPITFLISASNIPYFAFFFKNINSSIFEWFGYTGTTAGMVFGESSFYLYILLFFVSVVGYIFLMRKLNKWFDSKLENGNDWKYIPRIVTTLCLIALCIFGIRGRTGYNPIKISEAYYCEDPFLNQLGINPTFNLLTSVMDDMRKENAELHLMPYSDAITNTRRSLGITGGIDSAHILRRYVKADSTVKKRNVVFILMESMSGALLKTFGQQQTLTPTLDSLYHHSLAFTNFYSAGIHTNHGMTASLYSFPALMERNLMKGTVTPHRDGIPTVLKKYGYHNMFFMTHEAQYDNMNAFFRTNGYDDIYSQENYPKSARVNAFGVPDHFLFDYALPVINHTAKSGKPFFTTLLTVSNHPPFIIPSWFHPKTKDPETQIVEYADWCIGDFINKAKKQPWYKNTIFVILADHGKIVGNVDAELPQSYNHIPLIIFGEDVPQQIYGGLATQVDVMPTLLGLMNMSYEYNGFGINLLKQQRDMVFYSADNQIVARDMKGCYIYTPSLKKSFCYDVTQHWGLRKDDNENKFKALKQYVFSMIQTAEYMQRKEHGR